MCKISSNSKAVLVQVGSKNIGVRVDVGKSTAYPS